MSLHCLRDKNEEIYFCTITCHAWLNLFEITSFYDAIYHWFDILKGKSCLVVGYVIMPNHLHFMIYIPEIPDNLNKLVANDKRFMAYEIVARLRNMEETGLLHRLQKDVPGNERAKSKLHTIFKPSFDSKLCISEEMILQKLDYMHMNPVSGKWDLVDDYTGYLHSSAKLYELNEQGIYPVTHFKDIIGG